MNDKTSFPQETASLKEIQRYRKFIIVAAGIMALSVIIVLVFKIFPTTEPPPTNGQSTITFISDTMPTLRLGHYSLWAVDKNDKYSLIKRFNSVNHTLVSLNGDQLQTWPAVLPASLVKFVVTIEQEGDRNEIPSGFILFSAPVVNNQADLSFTDVALQNPGGSYILATPTDGNKTINEQSGIWFTTADQQSASLVLPDIKNPHWAWEARISGPEGVLIMGRFNSPQGMDNQSIYSGDAATGYNFPGEDFLKNLPKGDGLINLANGKHTVTISLEPQENGSDFTGDLIFIPVLDALIPDNAVPHMSYPLKSATIIPKLALNVSK